MTIEKAEVIAGTLENQAASMGPTAEKLRADAAGHGGARDICGILARNMNVVMGAAEKEIAEDDDLSPEQRERCLYHVSRVMRRIDITLQETARNQANLVIACNAQAGFAEKIRDAMIKQAQLELDKANRRKQLAAEKEAANKKKAPRKKAASKSKTSKAAASKAPKKKASKK